MNARSTRLLLVEDEDDAREALGRALEREGYVVRSAADAASAIAIIDAERDLDAAVVDLVLREDDEGGLAVIEALRDRGQRIPTVVITAFADVAKVKAALNHGAAHLLEKPFRAAELALVLRRVLAERRDLSAVVARAFSHAGLTPREEEIARLALKGLTSPEIAELLAMSDKTVRQHLSRVYDKCGVGSRGELFHFLFPL